MQTRKNIDPDIMLQNIIYLSKNPTRKWLHTTRKAFVISELNKINNTISKSAIEVGPGSGVYLPQLCSLFFQVTAVDINQKYLHPLKVLKAKFNNLEILRQDITKKYWPRQFDVVLCSEVIEHVDDTGKFIQALANITKPGGILLISTPQPLSFMEVTAKIALSRPFIWLAQAIYREPVLPTGHISLISDSYLLEQLKKNGFIITKTFKFGLYIPLLAEFGGENAVNLAKFLEKKLKKFNITWPLWTQLHLARKVS
jgi:2-polyprenyl-3-methyl-5-hydroxy-6-metoxy-1,4-benzoquinol methylase